MYVYQVEYLKRKLDRKVQHTHTHTHTRMHTHKRHESRYKIIHTTAKMPHTRGNINLKSIKRGKQNYLQRRNK
jgi:hypothetical protein